MTKCPNCNYSLSSSDVLCPKCGAMVEEINTSVPTGKPLDVDTDQSSSEDASVPDHYENIILYNESFPISDSEPPKEKLQEFDKPVEEPEEFDIENILTSNSGTKHVNPLLAHIERQRLAHETETIDDEEHEDAEVPEEHEDAVSDSIEEPVFENEEPAIDFSQAAGEQTDTDGFITDNSSADTREPIEKPIEDIIQPIDAVEHEDVAEETKPSNEKKESDEGFPIEGVPSYSQSYLDAIRSFNGPEEETEIEEFDPDAFMKQFKAYKSKEEIKTEPDPSQPEPSPSLPEPEEETNDEPVRRRYNPNKPKPKYTEEELAAAVKIAAAAEEARKAQEVKAAAELEAKAKAEEEAKVKSERKKAEDEKKKKEEEDILELELDSGRFFMDESVSDESAREEEHFVLEETESDEQTEETEVKPANNFIFDDKGSASSNSKIAPITTPTLSSSSKRLPVWATILIWIAVAAGLFFGAYTFEKYVKSNYDGYNNFIYEITDGQLDIENITE